MHQTAGIRTAYAQEDAEQAWSLLRVFLLICDSGLVTS